MVLGRRMREGVRGRWVCVERGEWEGLWEGV